MACFPSLNQGLVSFFPRESSTYKVLMATDIRTAVNEQARDGTRHRNKDPDVPEKYIQGLD